ncbi:MAG: hypothetical protein AB7U29_14610 [Desulfobulbus sp.]
MLIGPWFKDHCFDGINILPAVEALEFLAQQVHARYPEQQCCHMTDVSFPRFLQLTPGQQAIEVLAVCTPTPGGGIRAMLQTRKQLQTMTRLLSHCDVLFANGTMKTPPSAALSPCTPVMVIDVDRLYQDLVPFGPMYRSLRDQVQLEAAMAHGQLEPPVLPGDSQEHSLLGSPFSMDGAMHLACVHGQGLVDFIPFPVGLAQRTVHVPTRAGERYEVRAHLRMLTAEELVYDLEIVDQQQVRETILGLRMRDVSGGRIKPVDWMRNALIRLREE